MAPSLNISFTKSIGSLNIDFTFRYKNSTSHFHRITQILNLKVLFLEFGIPTT